VEISPSCLRSPCGSEATADEGDDLRLIPFGGADDTADFLAFGVDQDGRRQPRDAQSVGQRVTSVDEDRKVDNAVFSIEFFDVGGAAAVQGNRQHFDAAAAYFRPQPVKRRHFEHARIAPSRPEIQHHALAPVIGKSEFIAAAVEKGLAQDRFRRLRGKKFGECVCRRNAFLAFDACKPRVYGHNHPSDDQEDHRREGKTQHVRIQFNFPGCNTMTGKSSNRAPADGAGKDTNIIRGGRFGADPCELMQEINASVDFDKRLYVHDIAGSKAHCAMLVSQGIISEKDGEAILDGLNKILQEIGSGQFTFKRSLEDIHMNVEARLGELAGEAAGCLHTARSRNDQVATDFRLWVRDAIDGLDEGLKNLQSVLVDQASAHAGAVMPGFTHLQSAQPVTLGHHLLAYVEMFGRDRSRLKDCRRRLNECPLGAAALAGTSFPVDREMTARALGFDKPVANSMDAVSDRDFALEFLALAAILAVHLSRLAEEIVLWCSDLFAFARLPDTLSTGSSIMPQKRNPDAAELVRAKAGRVIGSLNALLVVMKGLPLAYGKDMQEDKEPVFDAADTLALSIAGMGAMLRDITFRPERMRQAAGHGHATATDLADWLVRALRVPFRRAHQITGRLVTRAEQKGCRLEDLSLDEMQQAEARINDGVFEVLGVENSVKSRQSYGGTAPDRVRSAAAEARKRFLE